MGGGYKSLANNLLDAGINYYLPTQIVERLKGDRMVEKTEPVLNNLIFIQTEEDIHTLIQKIDGLKSPFMNRATGRPATVSDQELQRFRQVLEARSFHADFLPDPYRRFINYPKVRVKAGIFEGMEGHVFRIRHDRKLIISLNDMAIAVSGIHHSLLELI
ncbi:MAG: transcription termination/antitermination NusG family protein [Bacteroidales bacterium]|nr:transcription termination/antitermination NusG family protein [Bacteroidales bacterium]